MSDPEPYTGVRALFNGDMHLIDPSYAPREHWVILDALTIECVLPHGDR